MEGYKLIKGRHWRATDPSIPDPLRQQLVNALMDARRAVAAANRAESTQAREQARRRVQFAKVALGERGPKWWQPSSKEDLLTRAEATLFSLLERRAETATLCPSEVSRAVRADDWRTIHPDVVELVWRLADQQVVRVTQRGERATRSVDGPIRIARAQAFDAWFLER